MKSKKIIKRILFFAFVFFIFQNHATKASGDITITEIMYNPKGSDTKREWIEIQSLSSEEILIEPKDWRFNDGSNHTLTLIQGKSSLLPGEYAILASDAETFLLEYPDYKGILFDTVMSLNNSEDEIKLSKDSGKSFFSQTQYTGIAEYEEKGFSLQISNSSWQHLSPTPGSQPIETNNDANTQESDTSQNAQDQSRATEQGDLTQQGLKIKITELFPNPDGDEEEYIELKNTGSQKATLDGFKISDAAKVFEIKNTTLIPGESKAFFKSQTKITLNNDKETVRVYDKDGNIVDSIEYSTTEKGMSYSFDSQKQAFFWTEKKTPSEENLFYSSKKIPDPKIKISNNPVSEFEKFYITTTTEEDLDQSLVYFWQIGNDFQANGKTFEHSIKNQGEYLVSLTITDGQNYKKATTTIQVLSSYEVLDLRKNLKLSNNNSSANQIKSQMEDVEIFINEIFPNPKGADNFEWIEIYNPNDFEISLDGWSIDDSEGGSKPYKIQDKKIGAKDYILFKKEETKITLNNTSDSVRIFDASGNLIHEIEYSDVKENQSYQRDDDGEWAWSEDTTPGKENMANENNFFSTANFSLATQNQTDFENFDFVDIDLPNIRELEIGTKTRTQGKVAVLPGVFGKTYFYITGSQGVQVYFYKKDWPKLEIGDTIVVIGEISEAYGETRIKISNKEDIILINKSDPPNEEEKETGEIGDQTEGSLVKICGQIIEKQSSYWILDDGTGEARLAFLAGTKIQKPKSKSGDFISVVGIVGETKTGHRIMPRSQEDIFLVESCTDTQEDVGEVLGSKIENSEKKFIIPKRSDAKKILYYLFPAALTILSVIVFIFTKIKKQTKNHAQQKDREK